MITNSTVCRIPLAMSYEGLTICIDGVRLDEAQKRVVVPYINDHHEGKLTHHQLIVLSRKACEKAGVPIVAKNEEPEYT